MNMKESINESNVTVASAKDVENEDNQSVDVSKNLSPFEEVVTEWIVHDYFNPAIKAEVILDMLLSEFITNIIAYSDGNIDKSNDYILLAKEFPISNETLNKKTQEYTLSSAKIDYLIAYKVDEVHKEIIMVELKTSDDSFNNAQFERYMHYIKSSNSKSNNSKSDNSKRFWEHYKNILIKYVKNVKNKTLDELKGSAKYASQLWHMNVSMELLKNKGDDKKEDSGNNPVLESSEIKRFCEELIKEFESAKFRLIYLTMAENENLDKKIAQLGDEKEFVKQVALFENFENDAEKLDSTHEPRCVLDDINMKFNNSNNQIVKQKQEAWSVVYNILNAIKERGTKHIGFDIK